MTVGDEIDPDKPNLMMCLRVDSGKPAPPRARFETCEACGCRVYVAPHSFDNVTYMCVVCAIEGGLNMGEALMTDEQLRGVARMKGIENPTDEQLADIKRSAVEGLQGLQAKHNQRWSN